MCPRKVSFSLSCGLMLSASQERERCTLGSCSPPFLGVDAGEGSAALMVGAVSRRAGARLCPVTPWR